MGTTERGETIPDKFADPEGDAELQSDNDGVLERPDSDLRRLWDPWLCGRNGGRFVNGTFFGRPIGSIPEPTVDAYAALEQALRQTGYQPRSSWSFVCRKIAGSSKSSLHSYGIAIDLDPALNPYSSGDPYSGAIKRAHVNAALSIKNMQGKPVWTWGGNWRKPDRMHFQIDQAPSDVEVDWSTVPGGTENGETMLTQGAEGEAVAVLQRQLVVWNNDALPDFGADGEFGGETVVWVRNFQDQYGLPSTGSIDGLTAALLLGLPSSVDEE